MESPWYHYFTLFYHYDFKFITIFIFNLFFWNYWFNFILTPGVNYMFIKLGSSNSRLAPKAIFSLNLKPMAGGVNLTDKIIQFVFQDPPCPLTNRRRWRVSSVPWPHVWTMISWWQWCIIASVCVNLSWLAVICATGSWRPANPCWHCPSAAIHWLF